jgi:hypothetical protein
MIIPASVEVLGEKCFFYCISLSSVTFSSESRLSRIEGLAFHGSGLVEIIIPASVEVLGDGCFSECGSLSSVTFESGSILSGSQEKALIESGFRGAIHWGSVKEASNVKE